MKKVILILGIAATLTSCQKDELEGFNVAPTNTTTDVKQLTEAYGLWNVESITQGSETIQTNIKTVVINGDIIQTFYVSGLESQNTEDTFYIDWNEPNTLITEDEVIRISINELGDSAEMLFTNIDKTLIVNR
tara:strand:+ start:41 stop:439 length:399 start_codon:yes stop_codon:yes gene_type:complete